MDNWCKNLTMIMKFQCSVSSCVSLGQSGSQLLAPHIAPCYSPGQSLAYDTFISYMAVSAHGTVGNVISADLVSHTTLHHRIELPRSSVLPAPREFPLRKEASSLAEHAYTAVQACAGEMCPAFLHALHIHTQRS